MLTFASAARTADDGSSELNAEIAVTSSLLTTVRILPTQSSAPLDDVDTDDVKAAQGMVSVFSGVEDAGSEIGRSLEAFTNAYVISAEYGLQHVRCSKELRAVSQQPLRLAGVWRFPPVRCSYRKSHTAPFLLA